MRWSWLLALSLAAGAQDRWVEVRSGPFEVLSAAGERPAQQALGDLEQFRHIFGRVLSREELISVWPIRVLVLRSGRRSEPPTPPAMGRDSFVASLIADTAPPREWFASLARILLDANARRLPARIEAGLLEYYSMVRINGVRITVGQPPPQPNLDWARIHLLSLHPDYYGKLRPLLFNLQQIADPEPAWKNALGKSATEIDKEAAAHLAAGNFQTEVIAARPLNPRTEFRPLPVEPPRAEIALADLRLVQGRHSEAQNLYEAALKIEASSPDAREGLALLALQRDAQEEARRHLQAAIQAGSRSARVYFEAARLEGDGEKALGALRKAAELNPQWAAPHIAAAERPAEPSGRVQALTQAAKLAPRQASLWRALAEAQEQGGDFRAAGRSWAAAEQAAADLDERERIREARRSLDVRRLEAEAAARRREAEEKERELARLKEEALRRIREAEARANRELGPPPAKVEPWFETPRPSGKVQGRLTRIDCLRSTARLIIQQEDGKLTRLVIRDPSKVVVLGGGRLEMVCGAQKQPRAVVIEYFPKPDAALGTVGEVATIEYR